MFQRVAIEVLTERGAPQLTFILYTREFDNAAQMLRRFPLAVLPTNLVLLQIPGLALPPGVRLPSDGLRLELSFDDPDPATVVHEVLLAPREINRRQEANWQTGSLTWVLQEDKGLLRRGSARSAPLPGTWAPYKLDWSGITGASVALRTGPGGLLPESVVNPIMDMMKTRLDQHGWITGMYTEMGIIHRL